jgi:hypothetical protein
MTFARSPGPAAGQLACRSARDVTASGRPAGVLSVGDGSGCPPGGSGLTRPSAITSLASRTRRFGPSGIRNFC